MTTVIAVLAVLIVLAIGVLVCVVKSQARKLAAASARAEQAERDRAGYQLAFETAEARAGWMKRALEKNVAVEEETNGKQQELAATPNSELVHRANNLFGGVSNKSHD